MAFKITTDEPLEAWCAPLHEGQVIEVTELDPDNPDVVECVRRYVAYKLPLGALVWEQVGRPDHCQTSLHPTKPKKSTVPKPKRGKLKLTP